MHRYKSDSRKSSVLAYTKFLDILNNNNIELTGAYVDVDTPTSFKIENIEFSTTPYRLTQSIIKTLPKFKEEIKDNRFKYIKIVNYTINGLEVLVEDDFSVQSVFNRNALKKFKDYRGTRIGRLIPISPKRLSNEEFYWMCKCECGSTKDKLITMTASQLSNYSELSCGCIKNKRKYKSKKTKKNLKQKIIKKNLLLIKNY